MDYKKEQGDCAASDKNPPNSETETETETGTETPISQSAVEGGGSVFNQSEILRAIEVVERDSLAIAQSFTSLFASLRLALSHATTTTIDHMQCFTDASGRLQESGKPKKKKNYPCSTFCLGIFIIIIIIIIIVCSESRCLCDSQCLMQQPRGIAI